MKVTKKQIIKALRTEPLGANGQFYTNWNPETGQSQCKVCAVGAVFRSLKPDFDANDACMIPSLNGEHWANATEKDKPLERLSTMYEDYMDTHTRVSPQFREKLVRFVRKEFPATINIKGLKAPKKSKAQVVSA